jgi:hypothetical protein
MKKIILPAIIVCSLSQAFAQETVKQASEVRQLSGERSAVNTSSIVNHSEEVILTRESFALPSGRQILKEYRLDISALKFSNQEEANNFFLMRTGNLISFKVDYDHQIVIASLNLDYAKTWDVDQWNSYLMNQFKR